MVFRKLGPLSSTHCPSQSPWSTTWCNGFFLVHITVLICITYQKTCSIYVVYWRSHDITGLVDPTMACCSR